MRKGAYALGLVSVALIVGLLVMQDDAGAGSRLASRVRHLENQVERLNGQLNTLQGRVSTLETWRSTHTTYSEGRFTSLDNRLKTVEARTSQLNSSGHYTGSVGGLQVTVPPDIGCWGDPAVWRNSDGRLAC